MWTNAEKLTKLKHMRTNLFVLENQSLYVWEISIGRNGMAKNGMGLAGRWPAENIKVIDRLVSLQRKSLHRHFFTTVVLRATGRKLNT